ncbi:MAG: protein kinase domain-containing protein [Candidatus Promineifilaceae bacterium]
MAKATQQEFAAGQFSVEQAAGEDQFREHYSAYEIHTGKPATYSVLKPAFAADDEFVQEYLHRAQSLTQIRHPNLLDYLETGLTGDSQPFVVSEAINGYPLSGRLARLVEEESPAQCLYALTIGEQLASGLELLVRLDILHYELTPAHILLRSVSVRHDNSVIIADLDLPEEIYYDNAPANGGSREYLSPEQRAGHAIDGRSHIYSVGVILYELLCGKRPAGPQTALSRAIETLRGGSELDRIRPDLTSATRELVTKSLSKSPRRRYASVTEFRAAISAAIAAENLEAHGSWDEVSPQPRRAFLVPLLILLLCLAAGLSILGFLPSMHGTALPPALITVQPSIPAAAVAVQMPSTTPSPTWIASPTISLATATIIETRPDSDDERQPDAIMQVTGDRQITQTLTSTTEPSPRPTRTPTGEPSPTVTVTPQATFRIIVSSANLRNGPGTFYDSIGYVLEDEQLEIIARSTGAFEWLNVRTENGRYGWVALDVGELLWPPELTSIVPAVTVPAPPTATFTSTPTDTPTPPTSSATPVPAGGNSGGGGQRKEPQPTPTSPI